VIPYIIITVIGVGASVLMMGGDELPTSSPPTPVENTASFQPLADAMYWIGGCSVTCSLIWGGCIVYTSRLKRKDNR
jgi:hypothetical protein